MAELTAEIVRTILNEEISGVRDEVSGLRADLEQGFAGVRQEFAKVKQEFVNVRAEMLDATDQILESVQRLNDDDRDEMSGITGRLRNHNERIAKLERLSNLR